MLKSLSRMYLKGKRRRVLLVSASRWVFADERLFAQVSNTPPGNFPFLQDHDPPSGRHAAVRDTADILSAHRKWYADTVTAQGARGFLRVQRPSEPGLEPFSIVSEGIAYGMLIAVCMSDKNLFDNFWRYSECHRNTNDLMDWHMSANGNVLGGGTAAGADEDAAWVLVMAHNQWHVGLSIPPDPACTRPSDAPNDYLEIAKDLIQKIRAYEADHPSNTLKPGDGWGGANGPNNISYYAPAYYHVLFKFAENFFHSPGQRLFNMGMEGVRLIDALDRYASAGHDTAYDVTMTGILVQDGEPALNLTNDAKINALEVERTAQLRVMLFTTACRKILEKTLGLQPEGEVYLSLRLYDEPGGTLANGVYYLVVRSGEHLRIGKVLVLR